MSASRRSVLQTGLAAGLVYGLEGIARGAVEMAVPPAALWKMNETGKDGVVFVVPSAPAERQAMAAALEHFVSPLQQGRNPIGNLRSLHRVTLHEAVYSRHGDGL